MTQRELASQFETIVDGSGADIIDQLAHLELIAKDIKVNNSSCGSGSGCDTTPHVEPKTEPKPEVKPATKPKKKPKTKPAAKPVTKPAPASTPTVQPARQPDRTCDDRDTCGGKSSGC